MSRQSKAARDFGEPLDSYLGMVFSEEYASCFHMVFGGQVARVHVWGDSLSTH